MKRIILVQCILFGKELGLTVLKTHLTPIFRQLKTWLIHGIDEQEFVKSQVQIQDEETMKLTHFTPPL